jgi:long-subunit fatty acid transport protein
VKTVDLVQPSGRTPQVFNWRSSFDFGAGLTHHFKNGYSVGGGGGYCQSAVPDAHFNPSVPDLDVIIYSVGGGHQGERWSWNVGYQGFYGARTVSGSAPSPIGASADGRYEGLGHFLVLSLGLKF